MSSPKVIVLSLIGTKLGNATMSYLHARAHAERVGAELQCDPWIGEEIWDLTIHRVTHRGLDHRDENTLLPHETNVMLRTYAQSQRAMIYTALQAREWLRFRRPIEEVLADPEAMRRFDSDHIVAHLRRGDFAPLGYPVISVKSYVEAVEQFHLAESPKFPAHAIRFVCEERPTPWGKLPSRLSMLPDFYRMVYAPVLLRANSSFSWVAGLLNPNRVFSPVINEAFGGKENDCKFVEGNWPRLSMLPMCSDLHLPNETV